MSKEQNKKARDVCGDCLEHRGKTVTMTKHREFYKCSVCNHWKSIEAVEGVEPETVEEQIARKKKELEELEKKALQ